MGDVLEHVERRQPARTVIQIPDHADVDVMGQAGTQRRIGRADRW